MTRAPACAAPRARVSSERWFSNAVGSSALLRWPAAAPLHRRRAAAAGARTTRHPTLCAYLLLVLLAILVPVRAQIYTPPHMPEALQLPEIVVDPRYVPAVEAPHRAARRRRSAVFARQDDPTNNLGGSSSAEPPRSTSRASTSTSRFEPASTTAFASTGSATASATSSGGIVVASDAPSGQLPRPFDTSLGNNFTNPSCPQFFKSFLDDPTFNSCLPLSMLLMNSQSFFEDQNDIPTLHRVLDATCQAVSANCANIMSSYGAAIAQQSNCGADLAAENPVVQRAQAGFLSYLPLYNAGCLKADAVAVSNKSPSEYCFAAAVANTSAPADSYLYYLALGVALPGASRPTCSSCTQRTMQLFATAAQNLSSPLAGTYAAAAQQINAKCGPGWVNATVTPIQGSAPASSSGAEGRGALGGWAALGLAAAAAVALL